MNFEQKFTIYMTVLQKKKHMNNTISSRWLAKLQLTFKSTCYNYITMNQQYLETQITLMTFNHYNYLCIFLNLCNYLISITSNLSLIFYNGKIMN